MNGGIWDEVLMHCAALPSLALFFRFFPLYPKNLGTFGTNEVSSMKSMTYQGTNDLARKEH